MKLHVHLFITAILACAMVSCGEKGQSARIIESSADQTATGGKREIIVYLPNGYSKKTAYPVIYVASADMLKSGKYLHIADSLVSHCITTPFIIAGAYPSGNNPNSPQEIGFLTQDLIKHVDANYATSATPADRIFFGVADGADLGLSIGMNGPDSPISEYWCFSPEKTDISTFVSTDATFRICWSVKQEVKKSFDYFPTLENAVRKRGGKVRSWHYDEITDQIAWQKEFTKLVVSRFGVEQ